MEKLVSNEEIENKAKELVNVIKEDNDYKEYITLRKKLKSNQELMSKIENIKKLQKEYVKSAYLDTSIESKLNKELKDLETMPLYKEYIVKENKINFLCIDINEGLNILFNDILNQSDK